MRFFPHAAKRPLLGMESKRERREREEERKFKQWSKKQEACSYWSQNYFLLYTKGKYTLVDNFNLTKRES